MSATKKKGSSPIKSKVVKKVVKKVAKSDKLVKDYTAETINLQPYMVPGSILLSGIMISVGLFFGLRASGTGSSVDYGLSCSANDPLSSGCLQSYADEIDLDMDDFTVCVEENKYNSDIDDSVTAATNVGVQGTPSTFFGKRSGDTFNGFSIAGGTEYAMLADIFEYAEDHSIDEVRSYWRDIQIKDIDVYEQMVIDYFSSAEGGSQTGEELDTTTKGYVDERLAQIESEFQGALIETDLSNMNVTGDSENVFLEYSDYECPYCIDFAVSTGKQIKEGFVDDGRLAFAFADFPLDSIHPSARNAANAARCAGDQDKYFEYHDKLFGLVSE